MPHICLTGDGVEVDPGLAVFPILKQVDGRNSIVGTAFFIAKAGIFVTAKHVIQDVLDTEGRQIYPIAGLQILTDNRYTIRQVISCHANTRSDVVVGVLEWRGEEFCSKVLALTLVEPRIGSSIHTYAYPGSNVRIESNVQTLTLNTDFYDGILTEHLPEGRDRTMLPFPCYRGDIRILGGASGGPVFDDAGRVFGVNCTGFEGDGNDISYFTRINEILPLRVDNIVIEGVHRNNIEVIELVERRIVIFEPQFNRNQLLRI